ncbi:MAG: dihydroorotate dehydrogenase (quinone), partial [Bartonella sp.]|nr:dihydroorotate dehydrogenase (quinone) [Bartonella sp.]
MIYEGPNIAVTIMKEILQLMQKEGVDTITAYRDYNVDNWAKCALSL